MTQKEYLVDSKHRVDPEVPFDSQDDNYGTGGNSNIGNVASRGMQALVQAIMNRAGTDVRWRAASPERTNRYICDALQNDNLMQRDKPGMANDLSWRDAEHYMFGYDSTKRSHGALLPPVYYSSAIYSPVKMGLDALGLRPSDMSPGSLREAKMGIDGASDAMDELVGANKGNRRWGNNCAPDGGS